MRNLRALSYTLLLSLVAGCRKPYPPAGNISDEMDKAVRGGDITFVQRQLTNRLVNPDDQDVMGMTGLSDAANVCNLKMARVFVDAGGDVNHLGPRANPPSNQLWQASMRCPEVYDYLLKHGAKQPEPIRDAFTTK